ncbi:MAG: Transcriptional regulator, TrmB [Microgenomates group bacterium GW2011_GWC1_41_8]|nr:MAG: Transcriptional regulator, TrmB [Microgenomates group bacterium GW2011_GWC1_41_8]
MKKILKKIGLTDNEAKLYIVALRNGPVTITTLAKNAGIKRTTTYSCVSNLKEKGLLSEGKIQKEKIYKAVDPDVLIDIVKTNQEKWHECQKELETIVPQLKAVINNKANISKIEIYEGLKNIWNLKKDFFRTLRDNNVAYQIGDVENFYNFIGDQVFTRKLTHYRRQIKNSKIYIISNKFPSHWSRTATSDTDFREIKLLPPRNDFEALILICGTKIWIFKMQTPFMGVIIESKEIVDLMTFMWRSIWDNLPKVVKDEHL